MVQGRYRMKATSTRSRSCPEDEWYIVENTHEAIIDRETLKKYSGLLIRDTRRPCIEKSICSAAFEMRGLWQGYDPEQGRECGVHYCRTYKASRKRLAQNTPSSMTAWRLLSLYAIQQQVYLAVDYTKTIERINRAPLVKSQSKN